MAVEPIVELVLYVDASLASSRAVYRWLRLLEGYTPGTYRFLVRDITRDDERAEADADGIAGIPALVIRGKRPERLVGDLSAPNAEWLARAALARADLHPNKAVGP